MTGRRVLAYGYGFAALYWLPAWLAQVGLAGFAGFLLSHGGPFLNVRAFDSWLLVVAPLALALLIVGTIRRPHGLWTVVIGPALLAWFALAMLAVRAY